MEENGSNRGEWAKIMKIRIKCGKMGQIRENGKFGQIQAKCWKVDVKWQNGRIWVKSG